VDEDTAYSFTPAASDVDISDSLSFTTINKPSWASFDTGSGELSGTPGNDDVGTVNSIVISVRDNSNATASLAAFDLAVVNVNDPPTISGTPPTSVDEDSSYNFMPSANDVDLGDSLTFSAANLPSWLAIDLLTGELSGTPDNSDVGTAAGIVITVTDASEASASLPPFNLTVNNVNDGKVNEQSKGWA